MAILYGAAVTFFVLFFASLTVYVGKWAVGLTASAVWSDRKPDYLFIYAPSRSAGRNCSPATARTRSGRASCYYGPTASRPRHRRPSDRAVLGYRPVDPAAYQQARGEFWAYNNWGAGIVCFWLTLVFLMMLGFSYSFFWSAATMIYLLMRQEVDEAELDEVYLEDEEPEPPLAPPKIAEGTTRLVLAAGDPAAVRRRRSSPPPRRRRTSATGLAAAASALGDRDAPVQPAAAHRRSRRRTETTEPTAIGMTAGERPEWITVTRSDDDRTETSRPVVRAS